jgi:hypothetical protein
MRTSEELARINICAFFKIAVSSPGWVGARWVGIRTIIDPF